MPSPRQSNKEARATPFASQCQAGNVKLVAGRWIEEYLDELMGFPNGKHDDQVDASSLAFAQIALGPQYLPPAASGLRVHADPALAWAEGGEEW
jgi:phage terminase large subunit-like protein